MKNFLKKFREDSFRQELWNKGDKLVLGVSGGPDSTCLMEAFWALKKKYNLELLVAHVNYGLRGKESDRDEKFVLELAKKMKLEAIVFKPRVKKKGNLEESLREIRYAYFEKIRKERKFDWIGVGHNRDDQVETFLQRLLRGAGMAGLRGMKFKNGRIIRPLLGFSRQEILEYLQTKKINYRTDQTNKKAVFFRNRIRQKLIPFLENNFNPNFRKTVFRTSLSLAEDYAFMESLIPETEKEEKVLRIKKFLALPPALQKRFLLKLFEKKRGNLKDITTGHLEEFLKLLKSAKSKNQKIRFQGLKIERKGDKVTILKEP